MTLIIPDKFSFYGEYNEPIFYYYSYFCQSVKKYDQYGFLKKRILQDGKCFEGGILKVDSFINHQMDPILMKSIGVEFVRRFANKDFNKVMTIEASGIAPAIMVGYLLELPVVLPRKSNRRRWKI